MMEEGKGDRYGQAGSQPATRESKRREDIQEGARAWKKLRCHVWEWG
jgi:hypothetical protein